MHSYVGHQPSCWMRTNFGRISSFNSTKLTWIEQTNILENNYFWKQGRKLKRIMLSLKKVWLLTNKVSISTLIGPGMSFKTKCWWNQLHQIYSYQIKTLMILSKDFQKMLLTGDHLWIQLKIKDNVGQVLSFQLLVPLKQCGILVRWFHKNG